MIQPSPNTTPLHSEHIDAGARMTEFAGWTMPLRFAGDRAEHQAVRQGAGLFDLSHMGQIEISGPQAAEALDRAVVSQCSRLRTGRARYTMLVGADGGILDDLIVYRLAEREFLVVANAANRATVLDALTYRSQGLQAAVVDRTMHRGLIAVQGPHSARILAKLLPSDPDGLRYYSATVTSIDTIPVLVARTGYTGEDGFELSVPADAAVEIWQRLLRTGGPELQRCGLAARDSLRLEAGMPLYGQELTADITPYEAGMGRLVHLDRDFVGAEALAQRAAAGPRSHIIALVGSGRRAARTGYPVLDDGVQVGQITSGVLAPTLGYPIAMARTRSPYPTGTGLGVDVRGSLQQMTVVERPFYTRS